MGSKIMNKKNVLISLGVALVIIVAGLCTFAVIQNGKIITNIACDGESGNCTYVVKTGLGSVIKGHTFTGKDVIQCSIENSKTPDVYELHLVLDSQRNPIILKSKNKDKISQVCPSISGNKAFIYEFTHRKR